MKKSIRWLFSNVEISLKKKQRDFGPIFHGLCLIGYKSINRRQIFE